LSLIGSIGTKENTINGLVHEKKKEIQKCKAPELGGLKKNLKIKYIIIFVKEIYYL